MTKRLSRPDTGGGGPDRLRASDQAREDATHADVDQAKRALGERGPIWWGDEAPELNRRLAHTAPYAGLKADR